MSDLARHEWVATHVLPHEAAVRAWLRRHVHRLSQMDIDDLMQEAYARLWTAEYTRIASGHSYLFTTVRNLLMEQARRARIVPMERLGEIESLRIPSEEPGPDRRVGALMELERLERVVAGLPEQPRRAFELQKFQHRSQREIALEMNITEKTVEKHLASALARIVEAFKDDDRGQAPSRPGTAEHDARQSKD